MSFTSGFQKSVIRGEKRSYCRFAAPQTLDPVPSSYLPNSFSETVRKWVEWCLEPHFVDSQ